MNQEPPSGTDGTAADLALAHTLADFARTISLARFRSPTLQRREKRDGSLVTDADEAIEDALRQRLQVERPEDAILGEERGQTGQRPRRWIVDAIDGTLSFAAGNKQWAMLLALEVDGRIEVGVCDHPATNRRYWASRGGGAFRSDGTRTQRLDVSRTAALADARVFLPPSMWLRDDYAREAAQRLAAGAGVTPPRLTDDEADDHPALLVAAGAADLAVFFAAGPWDLAAPSIVVDEAGGRFTDLSGGASLENGAVFSNGALHAAALDITAAR